MDRRQQVFVKLKLKAKALGFNSKELKGIAAKIADNLESQEDASEEDVNAEIDEKIEAVLPYLTFGQSQANRLLDEWKKNHPEAEPDDEPNDNFPNDTPKPASKKKPKTKRKTMTKSLHGSKLTENNRMPDLLHWRERRPAPCAKANLKVS